MKQVLRILAFLLCAGPIAAQTTLLDFETAATSTTYQYFGSSLDGSLNSIINNPDASGINTSSKVADHVKPAGSQVWAGAFPNPALQTPADMSVNNQVCLKVWFPTAGNVGVKLEGSATGSDWVRTVDVPQTQAWTEVCLDASLPSIEAPLQPAVGHVYPTVTLFFNFGVSPTADVTYYWDDLTVKSGTGVTEGDISFSVDMNSYSGSFTTVYVSGSFNNWSENANPLSDTDNDGIWTTTVDDVPVGVHEYKFQLDSWAAQEQFTGYETCVLTDPSGQFVNRKVAVSGDAVLPTFCYNSCYACGDAVNITIQLGAGTIDVSPDGLCIAGGGNFGNPGDFRLKDPNGDGIWTATIERQKGFQSFFTFTNGICPDYSCKENIAGQPCSDPANFNDRHMGPITQDTTIATCFGSCAADNDCGNLAPAQVTFAVDMSAYSGTFTNAYVSGSFNGWAADANPLSDTDGDNIWYTTLSMADGDYEFKFQLDSWAVSEEFATGEPCTITDPSGQFVNRFVTVDGDQIVCFQWNTCTTCQVQGTGDLVLDEALFTLSPTLASDFTVVNFAENTQAVKSVRLFNATGTLLETAQANGPSHRLETGNLPAGVYLVYVQVDNRMASKRFVKQ